MVDSSTGQPLNRASDADLLEAGQLLLAPTVAITKEINRLCLSETYQPFAEDLQKIVLATSQLSDLIKETFPKQSSKSAAEMSTISGTIQHDLNTPIIAITGYGELILEELEAEGDHQGCEILELVLQQSQKLLSLIKELNYLDVITPLLATAGMSADSPVFSDDGATDRNQDSMLEVISGMRKNASYQESANLLVVDDKESNRDFLSRRLIKQGFMVDLAENGQQALSMLADKAYDLILLDIIMPELNGYQVLKKLKDDERLKQIPVIMISALDEIDSVVKCLEMGAEDYLQKPFNQIILTTKINASLERRWLRASEQAHHETLHREQEKTEKLLLNILPRSIAERLKNGESSIVDSFDDVTVLFSDIVKFTEMSANMAPQKLVEKLNAIFLAFDHLCESHGLEKIKTIGDAYMLVGGMPTPSADHVHAVAEMAIEMQETISRMNAEDGSDIKIRIGIHTGPVVAGVIGKHKFSYDLWGDAVIVASRMESHSQPCCIQISDTVYQRIKDDFITEDRGLIDIKGQGCMQTYFLKNKKAGT